MHTRDQSIQSDPTLGAALTEQCAFMGCQSIVFRVGYIEEDLYCAFHTPKVGPRVVFDAVAQLAPRRLATNRVRRPTAEAWDAGRIMSTVTLRGPRGLVRFVPTQPVQQRSVQSTNPVRQVRLAIMSSQPEGSSKARESSLFIFEMYMKSVARVTWDEVDVNVAADFVCWRTLVIPGAPRPPKGFSDTVDAATALQNLVHVRAFWVDQEYAQRADALYGRAVSLTLRRLGAYVKHESVAKTPVEVSWVAASVAQAEEFHSPMTAWKAAFLTTGTFFFMRPGELVALNVEDVAVVPGRGVTVILRTEKARGGSVMRSLVRPRVRTVSAPLLVKAWQLYSRHIPRSGPCFPLNAEMIVGKRMLTHDVRRQLDRWYPGQRVDGLPLSMRAGGATFAWRGGMTLEVLMRMGRWASMVAVTYAVMTPATQQAAWNSVRCEEAWWTATGDAAED
jgi:hypothetical protein